MFVTGNSLVDVKKYWQNRLGDKFSESELKRMLKELVEKRLNLDHFSLVGNDSIKFSESDLLFFHNCQKRLNADEPFQYVLGTTWFYDLKLICDPRALIPRPETEELVQWVIETNQSQKLDRILDLCSGSGCIALAIQSQLPESTVEAIELSPEAIGLINENIKQTGVKIHVTQGDVLADQTYLRYEENSFDCWVSNPPYIPQKDKVLMHRNVLEFEPEMALFVENENPLLFYRQIGIFALKYLRKGGCLLFEIHENLAEDSITLLKSMGFVNIELRKDLQGKDRMIKATK